MSIRTPEEEVVQGDLFELWQDAGNNRRDKILFQRSLRARHYRLTLRRDGTALVTIPVRGSQQAAEKFVAQHAEWLSRARERQAKRPSLPSIWGLGTRVLWRGALCEIRVATPEELGAARWRIQVCLGSDRFRVSRLDGDLRPTLEAHFARIARAEIPKRAHELATETGVKVARVTVRAQRSRWGSCSTRGTISLNWRLVQTPSFVCDYIIYHELMHLREMNHSARFWAEVEAVCPAWRVSENWLKQNGSLLGL